MAKLLEMGVLLTCQTNKKERDFRKAVELETKSIRVSSGYYQERERDSKTALGKPDKNIRANSRKYETL